MPCIRGRCWPASSCCYYALSATFASCRRRAAAGADRPASISSLVFLWLVLLASVFPLLRPPCWGWWCGGAASSAVLALGRFLLAAAASCGVSPFSACPPSRRPAGGSSWALSPSADAVCARASCLPLAASAIVRFSLRHRSAPTRYLASCFLLAAASSSPASAVPRRRPLGGACLCCLSMAPPRSSFRLSLLIISLLATFFLLISGPSSDGLGGRDTVFPLVDDRTQRAADSSALRRASYYNSFFYGGAPAPFVFLCAPGLRRPCACSYLQRRSAAACLNGFFSPPEGRDRPLPSASFAARQYCSRWGRRWMGVVPCLLIFLLVVPLPSGRRRRRVATLIPPRTGLLACAGAAPFRCRRACSLFGGRRIYCSPAGLLPGGPSLMPLSWRRLAALHHQRISSASPGGAAPLSGGCCPLVLASGTSGASKQHDELPPRRAGQHLARSASPAGTAHRRPHPPAGRRRRSANDAPPPLVAGLLAFFFCVAALLRQ